ncbi:DUF1868 domain-containing protein [Aphanothece sacrum]|uniref:HIT family hydrolase n=1 Tax=Aphanothece sacrum FPU1 TaxID=1920663 RepID=A0A401IN86_APHSA|nr:DUF1868 domain-containing protein [Aphanothece sacrum]GBF82713.1 HIT family hydrolase [Aphanothece sacrum FPU1]GBF84496.1 HIT family hydrolase [Aphanothece sacrum FPU3]
MDETYQTYVNRVARLTLSPTYETQLQNIQKSPKFENRQPVPFPGYTVITPLYQDDNLNREFYHNLATTQKELLEQIDSEILIPLPPESFHLTVADLIWNDGYRVSVEQHPNFHEKIRNCLRERFQTYQNLVSETGKSQWQLVGLLVFPRALVVGLVPCNESSYDKIVKLRQSIYQNLDLIGLGVQQQYHFTAHVTLGYFDAIPSELDRDYLANILASFNDKWLGTDPQILTIDKVELRRFEDMTNYLADPNNPQVEI